MAQEELWILKWQAIIDFMKETKRRPSKHRIEDHRKVNWIKYNKKLLAAGKLEGDKLEKFNELLQLAESLHRKNQYA